MTRSALRQAVGAVVVVLTIVPLRGESVRAWVAFVDEH